MKTLEEKMGIFFKDKSQYPRKKGSRPVAEGRSSGMEETLRSEKIVVEHKTFYFFLKQNQRGRFLRITEESNGKSDTIIVPSTGVKEVKEMLDSLLQTISEKPNSLESNSTLG